MSTVQSLVQPGDDGFKDIRNGPHVAARKQVPLEDFYLLLEHGDPKTIRLFPGGHMGAIPNIFETIITWLHQRLDG